MGVTAKDRASTRETTTEDAPARVERAAEVAEMIERPSRDQESRASEEGHDEWDDNWNPSQGLLDAKDFPPREGFAQRWVRTHMNGREDAANVMRKANQGWRPRKASTVPKGKFAPTFSMRGEDVIGMDGIVLMERPLRIHEKHAAHIREMSGMQMQAVESQLASSHEAGNKAFGAPVMDANSAVSQGRPAPVADD